MNNNNFNQLKLPKAMLDNLNTLGYNQMTAIQQLALPHILDGKDVLAKAKTGSGKTATFGIGLLNNLNPKKFRFQSLILTPTRELATQVAQEIKKLARYEHNIKISILCGGVPQKPQAHSLSHLGHIIVGTPGRVLKHLQDENFSCDDINTFVLDEADKMLDMGFYEDIMEIVSYLKPIRQNMLFSATYPDTIKDMAQEILKDDFKVLSVEDLHSQDSIKQEFYIADYEKYKYIPKLINKHNSTNVIIFCNTKIACNELASDLDIAGYHPLVLHSDLEQRDRDETLILFANKSYPILIATDVASRGLDIKDIELVINYDLPTDPEVYVHRIGRTARNNNTGVAVSLVDDKRTFDSVCKYTKENYELLDSKSLDTYPTKSHMGEYTTIFINGGKKDKVRAGDILGALIQSIGLQKDDIGKIDILYFCSYVAIKKNVAQKAFEMLGQSKIKGKSFRVFLK